MVIKWPNALLFIVMACCEVSKRYAILKRRKESKRKQLHVPPRYTGRYCARFNWNWYSSFRVIELQTYKQTYTTWFLYCLWLLCVLAYVHDWLHVLRTQWTELWGLGGGGVRGGSFKAWGFKEYIWRTFPNVPFYRLQHIWTGILILFVILKFLRILLVNKFKLGDTPKHANSVSASDLCIY